MNSNKAAEILCEKEIREQILSQARAIYGPYYHKESTLDVVISKESFETMNKYLQRSIRIAYKAHVIVYHLPESEGDWKPVLSTQRKNTATEGLSTLLEMLREKLAARMQVVSGESQDHEKYDKKSDPFYM